MRPRSDGKQPRSTQRSRRRFLHPVTVLLIASAEATAVRKPDRFLALRTLQPPRLLSLCALWLLCVLLVPKTTAAQPQPAPRRVAAADAPRVRLVATGGTISNRTGGRLTAADLVNAMPGVEQYATPEYEQFANVASSQLTLDQWLGLAKRINELLATDSGLAGIVVTSGTDTLEETAYFLNLTVRSDRPVVVVGSMRNPSTLGYEGAANLLEGFRVAASADARGKGVLVVLNDEINAAREVTKTDALRLNTFQSRPYGILGVVDSDRVVFYRSPVKRHTATSEFDLRSVTALPRVDVILVYQGADGDLIQAAVDRGAKGIVIAGAGAGALSGTQRDGELYAVRKGAIVVTTTRTGSGRIAPPARTANPAAPPSGGGATALTADEQRRIVAGEDLLPVKARVLLMLALTKTTDPAEIQRMFSEY
jgi:L-asparaginase